MPAGGTLTIATRNRTITALAEVPPGDYVELTVSDTGRGMDDDTLRRIFEPRFTTRAESGGSGLGLCTVAEIVGRGGGFIQVDSEPGWGTRFRVFFPRG